jgi:DNA-binding beta-propeller fold protein YncE
VAVLDTTSNRVTTTVPIPAGPHGLVVTPDGSRVLVAGFGTDQVETSRWSI